MRCTVCRGPGARRPRCWTCDARCGRCASTAAKDDREDADSSTTVEYSAGSTQDLTARFTQDSVVDVAKSPSAASSSISRTSSTGSAAKGEAIVLVWRIVVATACSGSALIYQGVCAPKEIRLRARRTVKARNTQSFRGTVSRAAWCPTIVTLDHRASIVQLFLFGTTCSLSSPCLPPL